jgi:hypothetical protein
MADLHSGHKLGLLNPATVLVRETDDGETDYWTPELGATQKWLWEVYLWCLGEAAELAGNDEIVVVHAGDVTQGDRHEGAMKDVTRDDQREIARSNLLPVVEMEQVLSLRLTTGTAVHVPDCAEARVAAALTGTRGVEVRACHHERLRVDGVVFDIAHHGPPPGVRDWLRGNVALYYLKSAIYADRRMGQEPAQVYVRGHFHEYVPVPHEDIWHGQHQRYDLTILPSFCGFTEHARKVTRSCPQLTVGMVAYVIQGGQVAHVQPFTRSVDLRMEEEL